MYLPTGPLALLPLWGEYSSIVWSSPSPHARDLLSKNPQEFLTLLNDALALAPSTSTLKNPAASTGEYSNIDPDESKLGPSWLPTPLRLLRKEVISFAETMVKVSTVMEGSYVSPPIVTSLISERVAFPLQLQLASTYVLPRIALIGDAAHSIHPQAGQGLNLGITDVEVLVDILQKGLQGGSDIGSELVLQEYHNKQFTSNLFMQLSVDSIGRIFKSENKGLQYLRAFGMLGLHGNPFLKDKIRAFAAGKI